MIVKFHPRGRGGGAGPVDYLLGKDRQRDGAIVLQGKPEEVRELIDASPSRMKLNDHRLPPFPARHAAAARVRHQWPSARPPPEPGQRLTTGRR